MLKQLMLSNERKTLEKTLASLRVKQTDFDKRTADLATANEEASTDEELRAVEEALKALEQEVVAEGLEAKLAEAEQRLAEIDKELAELAANAPKLEPTQVTNTQLDEKREVLDLNISQIRDELRTGAYYQRAEVRQFYADLQTRGVTGEGLTIPQIIVDRILDIMGDYTTVYPLVDVIRVGGTARLLIDADTDAASWIEQNATIPTGDVGTISTVDFDGFKLGKLVLVDNYILQDSIINVDNYVTKKIARAAAKALDAAILNGTGTVGKQLTGIIPNIPGGNKVTLNKAATLADILSAVGLVDDGTDSVGTITLVMKRSYYYKAILPLLMGTKDGVLVAPMPNLAAPTIAGLPVVFNNNIADKNVLIGNFEKYTLVEREVFTIASSTDYKFGEDKTAYRGVGRFDGKPVVAKAFALVVAGE